MQNKFSQVPSENLVFFTSICILRCTLKWESRVRKMARDSSNTSGTEETPFLESATHRYCLMAFTNISWVRNTGPAPCSTDSNSCRETTLERNSWDLKVKNDSSMKLNTFPNNGKWIPNHSTVSVHCGTRALRSPPATSQFLWSYYWHDSSFTGLSHEIS